MEHAKIRLYVEQPLAIGNSIALTASQTNYLFNVMRLREGAVLAVFNGREGEWRARVTQAHKREGRLLCEEQLRPLLMPPDLWLLFAPIKKARTDFIVEKAAELGVARILPVQSEFTNSARIRQDRLQAHVIEAVEQCGGTYVPPVAPLQKLSQVLESWPQGRHLMFCDEALAGQHHPLPQREGPWAILIGPEGGFSDLERAQLSGMGSACRVSLGPRILRADTAAVAALSLWQASLGDWR